MLRVEVADLNDRSTLGRCVRDLGQVFLFRDAEEAEDFLQGFQEERHFEKWGGIYGCTRLQVINYRAAPLTILPGGKFCTSLASVPRLTPG